MATRKDPRAQRRTGAQNSRMWALANELQRIGLNKSDASDVLRDICENIAGHRHTSKLTVGQAASVIHQLQETVERSQPMGEAASAESEAPAREPWGRRGPGPRAAVMLTPKQQAFLQGLYQQAGMDSMEQQRAFSQRQTGRPWPQTQAHLDAIAEALKAIIMRGISATEARARFVALLDHPSLDEWKLGFVADVCERYEKARDISKVLTPHRFKKLLECEAAVARSQ